MQTQVLTDVKNTVVKYRMLEKTRRVIVAFSGGPDSVCMLHSLYSLFKNRIQFSIMYVNHGLRPENVLREEENLTKYYAVKYGLQCKIVRIQVKKGDTGMEAAARDLRYAALQDYRASARADRIALGHNSDDVVETFIMNMVRGSGAAGLGALSPVRDPYIRPLYELRKAEILRFVRAQELPFSEDATNQQLEFRRNLVRHKIVPELVKINPELHAAVQRSIELIRMDDACLDEYAEKTFRETARKQNERVALDIKKLPSCNPAVIGRVVRRAIKEVCGALDGFESKHIADIIGLKDKPSGKQIDLPKNIVAQRQFDEITIARRQQSKKRRIPVNPRDDRVELDGRVVRIHTESSFDLGSRKQECEVFDLDTLAPPLVFRTRRRGDNLVTKVGKKMLKKVYSEHKIPPHKRADLLMLCDRKGILLIPGVVRAYRGYVESKTTRFLVVDYEHTA